MQHVSVCLQYTVWIYRTIDIFPLFSVVFFFFFFSLFPPLSLHSFIVASCASRNQSAGNAGIDQVAQQTVTGDGIKLFSRALSFISSLFITAATFLIKIYWRDERGGGDYICMLSVCLETTYLVAIQGTALGTQYLRKRHLSSNLDAQVLEWKEEKM